MQTHWDVKAAKRGLSKLLWAALFLAPLTLPACGSTPKPQDNLPKVFFPAAPDPPRIQFLFSVSRASHVVPPMSGLDAVLFGKKERVDPIIKKGFGCTFHKGCAYVTDPGLGVVFRVDLKNKKFNIIKPTGPAGDGPAMAIDFAPDGTVYLSIPTRGKVAVLGPDWQLRAQFGPFGEKSRPVDAKVRGDRLYVADLGTTCVHVLDRKTGKELFRFGDKKDFYEFMRGPTSLGFDPHGNVYVSDMIYGRITVFDPDGNFIRQIGEFGNRPGLFARPKGLAVWKNLVFCLDAGFENCQIFDLNGRSLMAFGGPGVGPGNLYMPATVWVGTEGLDQIKGHLDPDFEPEALILITNQFGFRQLSYYVLGRSKKHKYPDIPLPTRPEKMEKKPVKEEGDLE